MQAIPEGSIIQLSCSDATSYLKSMLKKSRDFKKLYDYFEGQGMQFIFDRAKVYVYATVDETSTSPNVVGLLPSLIPTSALDSHHIAVTIAVHHKGLAIAGQVRVDHNPFRISEFTVHEVTPRGEIVTSDIRVDALTSLQSAEILKVLGSPPERKLDPDAAAFSPVDQQWVAAVAYRDLIQDKYASSLYSPSQLEAMLSQAPIVQKFASVNYMRYTTVFAADKGGGGTKLCTSTTTSCNACSSTCTSSTITIGGDD